MIEAAHRCSCARSSRLRRTSSIGPPALSECAHVVCAAGPRAVEQQQRRMLLPRVPVAMRQTRHVAKSSSVPRGRERGRCGGEQRVSVCVTAGKSRR